jgi:hypothetical protein
LKILKIISKRNLQILRRGSSILSTLPDIDLEKKYVILKERCGI